MKQTGYRSTSQQKEKWIQITILRTKAIYLIADRFNIQHIYF